jgi:citrate synthase
MNDCHDYKPGLEGVIAAQTGLSAVLGEAGRLIVRGREIDELAPQTSFEEMAILLWRGLLPGASTDAEQLRQQLATARQAAFEKLPAILALTQGQSLLEGLRTAWSTHCDGEPVADALALVAMAPVAIAAQQRLADGQKPIAPDANLGQAADFLHMLNGRAPSVAKTKAMETYLVTVADHGMNASTFTARVVASTEAGVISAVVAALCALKGPLHGGAPGPVLDMLDEISDLGDAEAWFTQALDSKKRLMGFGHRVYRTRDPRADVLKVALRALRLEDDSSRLQFAEDVERAALAILSARYPERQLDTNVEFYTALLLEAVGLPRAAFTPAFAMGRVLGWIAHVFEQGQAGRLMRPASRYTGKTPVI